MTSTLIKCASLRRGMPIASHASTISTYRTTPLAATGSLYAPILKNQLIQQGQPSHLFHTSQASNSRYPPLQVSFSKRARQKIIARQEKLRMILGPNVKIRNPLAPPPPAPEKLILPFWATNTQPPAQEIIPGKPWDSLTLYRSRLQQKKDAGLPSSDGSDASADSNNSSTPVADTGIRQRARKVIEQVTSTGRLELPSQVIPKATLEAPLPPSATHLAPAEGTPIPQVSTLAPPFYAYNLTPQDVSLLLNDTPLATKELVTQPLDVTRPNVDERAEIVRRLIALENQDAQGIRKFNIRRCMEMFGKRVGDSGSSDVQAAIATVRIHAMQDHLEKCKKDIGTKRALQAWVSKREKMLKYLRRTDLQRFVETCKLIGVDPDTIRVSAAKRSSAKILLHVQ
ncbi:hypothetical protein SmJEL517_g03509 [Synchytrium microbalum]|uniref:Ribosomal protein S15 n=1 Tax=Synchytrium microbalum TaxID=1806994 RepID=A0A507C3F9_9FUNG|nr:uncharacterized protein SmJEL517_g03509 [Synchytrium microbalum]TPX33589.1 hypothetical protein SmJEL517_g03509 [Synchytrium microbalum]